MNNLIKKDSFITKKTIKITPILNETENIDISETHGNDIAEHMHYSFSGSIAKESDFILTDFQHKLEKNICSDVSVPIYNNSMKNSKLNSFLQDQELILDILLELRNFDEKNGTDLFKNINYTNLRKFILKQCF